MSFASEYDWRRRWNARLGEVVACHGQPELPEVMLRALQSLVSFDHAAVFGYPSNRRPVFLYDGFRSDERRSGVTPYLRGTYLTDPFYQACQRLVAPGLYRMEQLAPPGAGAETPEHPGYVSPCVSDMPGVLAEEIGFFATALSGAYVVLSLMRAAEHPPFSEAELDMLREIEPVVRHLLSSQWPELGRTQAGSATTATRLSERIPAEIERFGNRLLTAREAEVIQLLLRGRSSTAIAEALGISGATVKIHRRNIYSKLNIASQAELFVAFLDHLSD